MQDKKETERITLNMFIRLYEEFPNGKVIAGESPDFLLKINTRKTIGIELTELKGQDFLNHTGSLIDPTNLFLNIKDTISCKERKLYLYRKNSLCQIWLLIHLNRLAVPANFNIKNKFEKLDSESGFDRIFLLETGREKLYLIGRPFS